MDSLERLTRAELIQRLRELESAAATATPADAVRDRDERLRAILDTAVEAIITINERGIIESANPAAERVFGYTAAELTGKNVSMLMPSPFREHHDQYIGAYLNSGEAKIIGIGREVVGQRKNGETFPMDLSVSEVRLATRRLFTGFVRDITERKRLEREILEISDRERRRIGQDLHDGLGQHLTGTQFMSEVLEQKLAGKSRPEAAQAGEIARHVREAIEQARSLARGLSPVVLEAEGLMAALEDLATTTAKTFRAQCRFVCPSPVQVADHDTATHLFRIAQEAVSNALKHGKAKQIEITLKKMEGRILLQIRDDGAGLLASPKPNTGMGLRIMQYRAGMIGGTLVVERNPGGGVNVLCSVPLPAKPAARK